MLKTLNSASSLRSNFFVCLLFLFVVFFYGEVSWFLAKFVLRCIRASFSVRLSPVIAEMSLTIVLNLLPNSLVLGRFTVQKHTLPGFRTPELGCVSPWYEEYRKILKISNNFFLICNPVQSNRTAVEENICDLNMSLCFTTWSESL